VFFGSVHGTLNLLLLGATIWMARFEGRPNPSAAPDAVLCEKFYPLHESRERMHRWIERSFSPLPADFERGSVQYVDSARFASRIRSR
jgi:uncharacterized damage-inducible protein DinB